MGTVYEVAILATNQGKAHNNIFAIWDGNDNVPLPSVADYFDTRICQQFLPAISNQFRYNSIRVKSLTGVNPGEHVKQINQSGAVITDPMPAGTHINVKLISGDPSFRAGGKMFGGWLEANYTGGVPDVFLLDFVQIRMDALIDNMDADIDCVLAIYRPSLSLPGLPQVSIVPSALCRGASTNNRRGLPFQR